MWTQFNHDKLSIICLLQVEPGWGIGSLFICMLMSYLQKYIMKVL